MEESNYAQRLRFLETTDLLPPCNPGHSTQEDRLLSRGQADAIANATGSLKHCLQPVHSCAAIGGAVCGRVWSGFLAPYLCLPSRVHNRGLTYSYVSYVYRIFYGFQ